VKKAEYKILVAEDDDIVRDVIVKFLTGEGYSVIVANNGIEAVEMLRLEDIKLVLSDLRMPGADGMEVLRSAVRINPNIAVVIITAYGTLDTALEAMKEGAYDYVVKPFVMQQLLLVVRNAFKMALLTEENIKMADELKKIYGKLEAFKKSGLQDSVITDDHEDVKEAASAAYDGNGESIKKYNSLVNGLKMK